LLVLLLAVLGSTAAVYAHASDATSPPVGRAAHTLNVTDTAHLHYVKSPGSLLLEVGAATGGLPGAVKAYLHVGPTVTASFTIYGHGWSISGHGSGKPSGTGRLASFGGAMSVSHGTGRYADAHGHGGFYGTIERTQPYAAVVQTTGTLSY